MIKIARFLLYITLILYSPMTQGHPMTHLSTKQQAMIPIAAFTANGDLNNLSVAIIKGLETGLTINEIKEIQIQLYAYVGFPRAINGVSTLMKITQERRANNIQDKVGKEATAIPPDTNILAAGTAIQTQLVGQEVKGPLFDFAPTLNQFLRAHLFGDIFLRDILNHQDREIATIAALATITGADAQLKSHYGIALNIGLTRSQLEEIIQIITSQVDQNIGQHANKILEQ